MDSEAVLQLYFGCESRDISEFVVFTPSPASNLDDFKELCDEVRREYSGWGGSGFVGLAGGYHVTVICPGTGSSQIGDATLAVGYGPCRVAIFVGSVGGLDGRMNIGDIVVVEEAVIGEGFSRYHLGKAPSEDTFGRIAQADDVLMDYLWPQVRSMARGFDVITHKGRIFTTESLLAETEQFLREVVSRGCIGIEKEVSAFYTAARKAKIRAAAVLCISDLPLHQKSLFVERTREEEEKRVRVRHEIIPQIVLKLAAGCYCLGGTP
jgi:purine-nucleoside phosphorylase